MKRFRSYFFSLILTAVFSLGLFAQTPVPVAPPTPDKNPKSQKSEETPPLNPATPVEKIETGKPADYTQEPWVTEQFTTRMRFENDGRGRREMIARIKVQSDLGVQELGQLDFGYSAQNEKMNILYVRVRKQDGTVVNARQEDIQDLSSPVVREAPIYTDFRNKHISVAGLRPGDTLEYHIAVDIATPFAPNQFWSEYSFQDRSITLNEQLELNVPADRKLKLKTKPGFDARVTEENGRKLYRWAHTNLVRKTDEQLEEEAKKRTRKDWEFEAQPDVQLTTFQSWDEVGHWYDTLQKDRLTPTAEMRAKVAELLKGRSSDRDKIEALYDFVAKNFRYVSLSLGLSRYQPHPASQVFAQQYGDCKDKHTLLASMLSAAGIKAYPVLINSSRKLDPDVPSPSQFDHVITTVPVAADHRLWLDTTTEIAPFGLVTPNLRNKQGLMIPTDGPARLQVVPREPGVPNTIDVAVDGKINEIGKLNAVVDFVMRGDMELVYRMAFRNTARPQWKQLGQNMAVLVNLRGDVKDIQPSDIGDTTKPFSVKLTLEQPNYLNWTDRTPKLGLAMPPIMLPEATADMEDKNDSMEFPGSPMVINAKLNLELPKSFSFKTPLPVSVKRDYATYTSQYKLDGSTLTAQRLLDFRLSELQSGRTRDYMAFIRALRADSGQVLNLENVSLAAGGPALPATMKKEELEEAANAALQSRNWNAGERVLKRLVEIEPKHKLAWNQLGFVYMNMRRSDDAISAFKKQVEANPYDDYAYNNLGRVLSTERRYAEAEQAFRKALEINPLDKDAQALLGQNFVGWKKYDAAVEPLENAVRLSPDDASLYTGLGQAYINLGKGEQAIASFNKALELAPSPTLFNNIAYELSNFKEYVDRSERYAESAVSGTAAALRNTDLQRLTLNDSFNTASIAAFWDTLGWIAYKRGDLDKAERYIRASWLLNESGEVGDHLGQIYEARGQKDKAVEQYASTIASLRPIEETRGRLAKLLGAKSEDDPRVQAKIGQYKGSLAGRRTLKLGAAPASLPDANSAGDFFLLFAQAGNGKGKLEQAKFVRGEESLKMLEPQIRAAQYQVEFPDATPVRIVRRGTVTCTKEAGCSLELIEPENVTAVD